MPRDATHGYAALTITSLALLGANPLWELSMLSQRAYPQKVKFYSEWQSFSPEIQEQFLKKHSWVYANPRVSLRSKTESSLLYPVLIPFCLSVPAETTLASDFDSPKSPWGRTLLHIAKKAVPDQISSPSCSSFGCFVFSLHQKLLKSMLWLWQCGSQARQRQEPWAEQTCSI